jgi:hypothetical protein
MPKKSETAGKIFRFIFFFILYSSFMYRLFHGNVSVWVKTAGGLMACLLNNVFLEIDINSEYWKNKTGSILI